MKGLRECLATLKEIITQQYAAVQGEGNNDTGNHEPTANEYFAVISSTLLSVTVIQENNGTDDRVPLLLKILVAVLPNVSRVIANSQFRTLSNTLLTIIKLKSENVTVLGLTLLALGQLLKLQDTSDGFWNSVPALQSVNALLSFVDDAQPQCRRTAHQSLLELFEYHAVQRKDGSALMTYISEFINGVMKNSSRSDYRRAHCLIILLESTLWTIPEGSIVSVIESCLRLRASEIPRLTAAVYRMLDSLFQSPKYSFSKATSQKLMKVLLSSQCNIEDVESHCYYITSIGSLFLLLLKQRVENTGEFGATMAKVFEIYQRGCEAEFTEVHCVIGATLKRIITNVFFSCNNVVKNMNSVYSAPVLENENILTVSKTTYQNNDIIYIHHIVNLLYSLLTFRVQTAWLYIFNAISSVFESMRGNPVIKFTISPLVLKLAEIQEGLFLSETNSQQNLLLSKEVLDVLAKALTCCNVSLFLSLVPFIDSSISKEELPRHLLHRSWVTQLLSDHLHRIPAIRLSDFVTQVLPLAGRLHKLISATSRDDLGLKPTEVKQVRNVILELWTFFTEMGKATAVLDFQDSFPRMKTILTQALEDPDYPEVTYSVIIGMVKLLENRIKNKASATNQEKEALANLANHFLPLLLAIAEGMEQHDPKLKETLHCVTCWSTFANDALITTVYKKLIQLVLTQTNQIDDPSQLDSASHWMGVLLAIIPSMPSNLINILYRSVRPLLSVEESILLQKRAYSLLNALIEHHSSLLFQIESKENVFDLVVESLLTAHVSSRNVRLHCIKSLLAFMPDKDELLVALDKILLELLACQKDANKKSRDGAIDILRSFCKKLPWQDLFSRCCAALAAETSLIRGSALNALTLLLFEKYKVVNKQLYKNNKNDDEDDDISDDEDNDEEDSHELDVQNFDDFQIQAVNLVPSLQIIVQQQVTEQTKATLAYIKVLLTVLDAQYLLEIVPLMIQIIGTDIGAIQKQRFSSRYRGIVRKLMKKFEPDFIRPLLPEADHALLDYIVKQQRRDLRKRQAKVQKLKDQSYDQIMASDSDDDKDDKDDRNNKDDQDVANILAKSVLSNKEDYRLQAGKRLRVTRADENIDSYKQGTSAMNLIFNELLKSGSGNNNNTNNNNNNNAGKSKGLGITRLRDPVADELLQLNINDNEDEPFSIVVNADGKVVVKEKDTHADDNNAMEISNNAKQSISSYQSANGNNQDNKNKNNKKRKMLNLKEPGAEYRAKNAGGDVWKKGVALQPHAYIPLDPRLLSKKHHEQAVQHFGVVVDQNKKNRLNKTNKRPRK